MKWFTLLLLVLIVVNSEAQETQKPVSNLEISGLAESVKLFQWAELAKKSNFEKKGQTYKRGPSGYIYDNTSAEPMQRGWDEIYQDPGRNGRLLSDGWTPEKKIATSLLLRPSTNDQKKWLVNFLATADALEQKDAKRFKELVVPLADDVKTLF